MPISNGGHILTMFQHLCRSCVCFSMILYIMANYLHRMDLVLHICKMVNNSLPKIAVSYWLFLKKIGSVRHSSHWPEHCTQSRKGILSFTIHRQFIWRESGITFNGNISSRMTTAVFQLHNFSMDKNNISIQESQQNRLKKKGGGERAG